MSHTIVSNSTQSTANPEAIYNADILQHTPLEKGIDNRQNKDITNTKKKREHTKTNIKQKTLKKREQKKG